MAIDIDTIIAAVQAAQLLKDKDTKAAPQSFDPLLGKFVPLLSDNGAARHVLYDTNGNPLSIVDNKLAVRAAELEEKLDGVRVLLNALAGEDFATQTTLAQILGKMIAAPATEAKQDVIAGHVDGVETLLTALTGKDFATQTTLAQILAKMIAAPATEAKQDSLATLVGAIEDKLDEGQLAVRAAELETAISNLQTALLGSQSTAAKQDALVALVGAIDAAAVSDPAAAGAVIALLKGVLERLQAVEGKIDGITTEDGNVKSQLTGSIATTISSPETGIKTVTATAAEVFAGATKKIDRRRLVIRNEDPVLRFRVGNSDITQQNGFPVEPGATIIFEFDPKTAVPIYAISEGAALKVGVCEE